MNLTSAECRMLRFLLANMRDLSAKDWLDHGFKQATFFSLEEKLDKSIKEEKK